MRNTGCQKDRTRVRLLKSQGCRRLKDALCTERNQKAIGWESVNPSESLTRKKNLVLSQKCTDHKNLALHFNEGGEGNIPRAEEAHLSVDVSRGPWSRTPGPLALVPEAAIILRPHKLFPTLQRNPKKVEGRSLRVTPEQEGLHCYSGSYRRLFPFCSPSLSLEFPHTNAPSAVFFFANIS